MAILKTSTQDEIPAAIAALQVACTTDRAPILGALRDAKIAHFEVARDTAPNVVKQLFALAEKPVVVLIGDTDQGTIGPVVWPVVPLVMHWARAVFLHSIDGGVVGYGAVVRAAAKYRRVVLVENNSRNVDAWRSAAGFSGVRRIALLSANGGAHPRAAVKS